jgi:hypothetical protein
MVHGVYKFLHSAHRSAVLNEGTIKVGSLSHYRTLEGGDQWIADRLEGRIEIEPGEVTVSEHEDKVTPLLPHSLRHHLRVESGGMIHYAPGVKITIEHPDVYIFSASLGDLTTLQETMCRGSQEQYDSCIGIRSVELLAHRAFFRGTVLNLNSVKMSRVFRGFQCSAVSYVSLSRTQESGRAPEVSPFLKDAKFEEQREFRIAFWPQQSIELPSLIIKLPRPDQLFDSVF